MKSIEIKGGTKVGFEEFLQGMSKLDVPNLEELSQKISELIQRKKQPRRSNREIELVKILYQKLPVETQSKFDDLKSKSENQSLTAAEHAEYLKIVEIVGENNLNWLKALAELAKIRGISLEETKKQLGFPKHPPFHES